MPSVFVVSEVGPLKLNIHRAIEHELPKVSVRDIPEEVMDFVEMIWGKYGSTKIDALNRLVMQDPAFKEAEMEEGMQEIISLDAMQRYYAPRKPVAKAKDIPDKLPDEMPDFIADILSTARDEAHEDEDRKSRNPSDRDKPRAAWVPGMTSDDD